ncbi:MAG: mechanosensitive ion channel family protein [Pseudomonadota bacterium]
MRLLRSLALAITLLGAGVWGTASAEGVIPQGQSGSAPQSPVIEGPLTEAQATALISRLSDEAVRTILLEQLATKAEEAVEDQGAEVKDFVHHLTSGAFAGVVTSIERVPILFTKQAEAFRTFYTAHGADQLGRFVLAFLALIAIAAAVEWLFRLFVARRFTMPETVSETNTLRETVSLLTARLFRDVAGVLVFIFVARQLGPLLIAEPLLIYAGLIGSNLIAIPRIATAVARFLMAPKLPAFRLVHASDTVARASVFHMFWFAVLIGVSTVLLNFNQLNGVPLGETRLGFWLNLAVHVYVALVVWRYWDGMVAMMRGAGEVTPMEARVARAFPAFAIAVSIGTWWVVNILVSYKNFALLVTSPHYKTMALLLFAPALDTLIRGLVRHLAPAMTGEGTVAERAHRAATRSYIRIGRVIIFGCVLIAVASFWGMSPTTIASAGVGERVAAALVQFLMILSVGYLIYEVVSLYINQKLAAEITASGYDPDNADFGGDGGGSGGSRLSTVLPLVLAVARVAIVVLFVLLGLSNVGIDTTPLLAGAGIVGLAIGFGAQKLVTDVVSGIFFLVDDAFRTGEYVEVEGTMGTVERISIRSMQLRHHKGPIHTIPYGEIPKLTNYSRDWVIMKLKFTVPFDTDPNKVKKIFKRIGQEMLEHETLGQDFLQPFKSQGVFGIDDVGIVVRGKYMAKPGKQFMIRKEIYNRVKAEFDAAGIDFARREVRVAIPSLEDKDTLSEEQKTAIAAAGAQAAQDGAGGSTDDR